MEDARILKESLKDGALVITRKGDSGIVNLENGTLEMTNIFSYGKPFYKIQLSKYDALMRYVPNHTHDVLEISDQNDTTCTALQTQTSSKIDWASYHLSPQTYSSTERALLDKATDIFNRWNDIYAIAERGSSRYADMMIMIKDIVDLCKKDDDKGKGLD